MEDLEGDFDDPSTERYPASAKALGSIVDNDIGVVVRERVRGDLETCRPPCKAGEGNRLREFAAIRSLCRLCLPCCPINIEAGEPVAAFRPPYLLAIAPTGVKFLCASPKDEDDVRYLGPRVHAHCVGTWLESIGRSSCWLLAGIGGGLSWSPYGIMPGPDDGG